MNRSRHRASVYRVPREILPSPHLGVQFAAECSCGWVGTERIDWRDASRDATAHENPIESQEEP